MPRSPTPIALSGEERQPLQAWQRAGSTEQRMVARAQIILRAAAGEGTNEIQRTVIARQLLKRFPSGDFLYEAAL